MLVLSHEASCPDRIARGAHVLLSKGVSAHDLVGSRALGHANRGLCIVLDARMVQTRRRQYSSRPIGWSIQTSDGSELLSELIWNRHRLGQLKFRMELRGQVRLSAGGCKLALSLSRMARPPGFFQMRGWSKHDAGAPGPPRPGASVRAWVGAEGGDSPCPRPKPKPCSVLLGPANLPEVWGWGWG